MTWISTMFINKTFVENIRYFSSSRYQRIHVIDDSYIFLYHPSLVSQSFTYNFFFFTDTYQKKTLSLLTFYPHWRKMTCLRRANNDKHTKIRLFVLSMHILNLKKKNYVIHHNFFSCTS